MKQQDGIALVATLLIMAAIMALGVGSLFLSSMNLQIAENSRTQALARYNAEAGMGAAIVKLKHDYAASTAKQFPATLTLPSPPESTITYQSVSYTPYTTGGLRTQARVVILGTGPNNARYQTEALFGQTAGSGAPSFPPGLISKGVVRVDGNHKLYNARIHGDQGFSLNGNGEGYYNCTGTLLSICLPLTGTNIPVSAGIKQSGDTYSYTCKSKNSLCDTATNQPKTAYLKDKVTLEAPPYITRRNATFGTTSMTTTTESSLSGCTHTVSSLGSSYPSGSKVCLTRNASLTSARTYSNVTIIVKGTLTIDANVTFNNTNVLSTGALTIKGNVTMNSSRLFSDTDVLLEGNVPYTGAATIAAGRNMEIKGNIEHTASNDIGMALMALNNFTANGNMEGKNVELVNIAAWVGGTTTIKGNTKIRGGISSVGNLEISGNTTVDGRGTFTNADLSVQELQFASVSRR